MVRSWSSGASRSPRSPPAAGEGRGVDVDAEERQELVVVERRGPGALDAREDGCGR